MMYEKLTDACHAWVEGFNAIPGSAVEKIWNFDESIHEITPVCMSDRVRVIFNEYAGERGEVIGTNVDNTEGLCEIKLDNGEVIKKYSDDIEVIEQEGWLPIWGYLWSFGDQIDEDWLTGQYCESHLQEVADLGFRIYESEDFGILIGIDCAGVDFYEYYWCPLYKLRGLHWHKIDDTVKENAG